MRRSAVSKNSWSTNRYGDRQITQNIQRHIGCPTRQVPGTTVRDVLNGYFSFHEQARGYVLDDQVKLRPHTLTSNLPPIHAVRFEKPG